MDDNSNNSFERLHLPPSEPFRGIKPSTLEKKEGFRLNKDTAFWRSLVQFIWMSIMFTVWLPGLLGFIYGMSKIQEKYYPIIYDFEIATSADIVDKKDNINLVIITGSFMKRSGTCYPVGQTYEVESNGAWHRVGVDYLDRYSNNTFNRPAGKQEFKWSIDLSRWTDATNLRMTFNHKCLNFFSAVTTIGPIKFRGEATPLEKD